MKSTHVAMLFGMFLVIPHNKGSKEVKLKDPFIPETYHHSKVLNTLSQITQVITQHTPVS